MLDSRIHTLLAQLQKLSEAPAARMNKGGKRAPHESKAPPGAKPEHKGSPDPDDSLLHYFVWKLDKAKNETMRKAVVAEVEIRLERRKRRPPSADIIAGSTSQLIAVRDRIKERDRRIAEDYVGLEPAEVEAIESEIGSWCPQANIRKVRILAQRDPKTGHKREQEVGGEEDAVRLSAEGLSIGAIAFRLGRPKSTVQTWLAKAKSKERAA